MLHGQGLVVLMDTEKSRIALLLASLMSTLNHSILSSLLRARGSLTTQLALLTVIVILSVLALAMLSELLRFLSVVVSSGIVRYAP